jgi:hypothetical protein
MLQKDDGVRGCQVQAEASHMGGEQHDWDRGIAVEPLHNAKSRRCFHAARIPDLSAC